jgi:hypothetical protein
LVATATATDVLAALAGGADLATDLIEGLLVAFTAVLAASGLALVRGLVVRLLAVPFALAADALATPGFLERPGDREVEVFLVDFFSANSSLQV